MKIRVVLTPTSSGFTCTVPVLPWCITEGATEQEALDNVRSAIALYLIDGNEIALVKPGMRTVEIDV